MPDVEMKPAEPKQSEEEKIQEESKPVPVHPLVEIKNNVALIDRAVTTLEPRFTHRVLRTLTALRKRIDASILRNAVETIYTKGWSVDHICFIVTRMNAYFIDTSLKNTLLAWIPDASDSDDQTMEVDAPSKTPPTEVVPEVEMYLRLLILYQLLEDEDDHATALDLANETVKKMQDLNRRSMDAIAAKIWMAVDRAYSANDLLPEARPYVF